MSDDRLRVVLMITELRPAGAERVIFELATRLDRRRFDPTVLALRSFAGQDGSFAPALRAKGVRLHMLRVRSKLDLPRVPRLVRLLRSLRPDVLNAHLFHANLVARLVAPLVGKPAVVSTHHVVERRRLGPRFVLDRVTAPLDDATVAVSRAVARFAVSTCGVRPDRIRIVEDGVDLAPLRANAGRDGASFRESAGIARGAPLVGALGRLDIQKGHDDLVRAWPAVLSSHPGAVLAIAGEGVERRSLERLARALGVESQVRLLGYRSDVPAFLSALDVFCMPSRWEGFGLALVEALAAGKACIASSADSLPEVLGDAGLLVAPRDPRGLAAAVSRLLASPEERKRFGEAARSRAELFSVERMVAAYEKLYEDVARGRASRTRASASVARSKGASDDGALSPRESAQPELPLPPPPMGTGAAAP